MNEFPNLNSYGYQILERIGNKDGGGCITWKGKDLDNNELVWVKQFCFATADSSWSGYKAYQKEVSILQNLNHPGIPQYIGSFETNNGFCLIQKYIQAQNLDKKNRFTTAQIKLIAKKILEILVYLQRQNPPILHQNIKPENILIDELGNIYLVDFGLANNLNENTSSLISNTPGFIAPKQQNQSSKSSDLYGIGATIICLLTNKKSSEIVELIAPDNPYKIQFKNLIPDVDSDFIDWIEKMVNPQREQGFTDAKTALKALKEIDWDLRDNTITIRPKDISLSTEKYIFSTVIMGALGIASAIGFQVTNRVTDKTIVNITIAAIALIVVYIAQYGAATAFKTNSEGKTETLIFAIATPITLTMAAGLIFGKGEAVAISFAATMAQTGLLTTILWQKLVQNNKGFKIMGLLGAIVLGIILGLKVSG